MALLVGARTWIIETELNAAAERVAAAARASGCPVIRWSIGDPKPALPDRECVFLGSLTTCPGMPGVLGDPERLRVSRWLPRVGALALNREVVFSTVGALGRVRDGLPWARVFARPDSAMKPFAGRVLAREQLSAGALDHGFYYDDLELPIVLAPARAVAEEWRFVVVDRRVVASCGYTADGRAGLERAPPPAAVDVAYRSAELAPEDHVVLDVCRVADDGYFLVEYNLLSGADLYACDVDAIVRALA